MSLRARLAAAAAVALFSIAPVRAATTALVSAFDGFYRTDLDSRKASLLGATGLYASQPIAIEGMAYAPDGTLYGVSDNQKALFRLNPDTGKATQAATIALSGEGQYGNLDTALAVTADGRFWLTSATLKRLWRLDPATGAVTEIGPLGAQITGLAARGNALYGAGSRGDEGLYRIDTRTGAATLIARFNGVIPYAATISLAFDASSQLWAVINYNPPQSETGPIATWSDLAKVDSTTGSMQLLGALSGPASLQAIPVRGLSITAPTAVADAAVPIPATSPWALTLLALALVAGTLAHRRRPSPR